MLPSHRFGRFEVRPLERQLLIDGRPAVLGARAFDVLVVLIEQRDRVVTKHELLDRAWPGLIVEENNLATQVSTLRKLLGAAAIATIPGRGYRFTAAVANRTVAETKAPPLVDGTMAAPLARIPTNLAAELPPLYGRDDDLGAIRAFIDAHRLVTIVGPGGIGKTRLAEAAAYSLRQHYPDGVWLVELAPLTDGAMLPGSVAHALGISLSGLRAPCDELVATLEAQHLLLVLDNCEYLVEAVVALSQALLDRAPGTHLLVTSQTPLGLPAERLLRLEPLALPETLDAARALDYGAVRLLSERVTALDRHFKLDARNIAAVVEICRQLDGLPLAIELAAARIPLLGVQGVHERLAHRFQILTSGSCYRPKRHRTMRAALDWSHGLLGNEEQLVFRRLGVFSGGCTIEAAQHVISDGQLDEWVVLELLGRLVDRSLVVAEGGERPRFRLLESMRAYAIEKLADAGETATLQRRHAEYFAASFGAAADALYAAP